MAVPVPDNDTVVGELEALLAKVIVPGLEPVAVGKNTALNVLLCPAVRVSGKVKPVTE
jgi:hypothetical protein